MALVERSGSTTYRQLTAAASRAAGRLAEAGVLPRALVPVLLPRGRTLVATVLGIVGIGAGYVALDRAWPRPRARQVRASLDAPILVTDGPDASWSAEGLFTGAEVGPSDSGRKHGAPGDVCSVFFTSGSAGLPKGVLASRRGLTGLLRPGAMPLRFDRSTVMTVAAPTPWDGFALEMWGPLCNGGSCVLAEGDFLTPAQVREYVGRYGLNTVWLTSSLFNLFVEEDLGAFSGLTQVATGGERLSADHVREFLRAHPGIKLFNGYGPAENCIFSTMRTVTLDDCALPTGIPIGRPVGGTAVYILDGERRCQPGELGELCLAGERLSPGYLDEPELTRRAFVNIDVAGVPTRIYRTGDLGWCDRQGVFHFHGRLDRQVKVRGHRVEPAEIERQLAAHPGVAECVVVPETDATGATAELVACYRAAGRVSAPELHEFLRGRLPDYLVPGRWRRVDRLPLLDNGKVDVDAVRASIRTEPIVVPANDPVHIGVDPVLAELGRLAYDITRIESLPADGSLVAAGANSLQLLRLCLRAERRFGAAPDSASFLGEPTLAHLAELIGTSAPAPDDDHGVGDRQWPLNPMQSAFLATEVVDPDNRQAWHCVLVWRINGTPDRRALERAVAWVHRRHPALHARYPTAPPFRSALVEPPTEPEFTALSCPTEAQADAVSDRMLHATFDLDRGPAWRSVLVRIVGQGRAIFGVAVHHVAFDGWSEHVLARDLTAAYAAELAGAAGPGHWFADRLPWPVTKPVEGARLDEQRRLLAAELADTPALRLPAPSKPAGTWPELLVRTFDQPQTRRYEALCRQHATTPFVLGLAACAAAASQLTGAVDFPLASPVVRRHSGNDGAIGCLLNLLCIRLRLPGNPGTPPAVVAAAKDAVRNALVSQDVPFPEAVSLLRPRPDLGHPEVPSLFVLQQNTTPALRLPGCRARLTRPVPRHAGFNFQVDLRLPDRESGEVAVRYRPSTVDGSFAAAFANAFVAFVTAAPAARQAAGSG